MCRSKRKENGAGNESREREKFEAAVGVDYGCAGAMTFGGFLSLTTVPNNSVIWLGNFFSSAADWLIMWLVCYVMLSNSHEVKPQVISSK